MRESVAEDLGDGRQDVWDAKRLDQIARDAKVDGVDGRGLARETGDHEHGQVRLAVLKRSLLMLEI